LRCDLRKKEQAGVGLEGEKIQAMGVCLYVFNCLLLGYLAVVLIRWRIGDMPGRVS
jgi:hypothetical protein